MSGVRLTDLEESEAAFGRWVDQHDQRRRDGLPTVSTLVGPVAIGKQKWQDWAVQHQRSVAIAAGALGPAWLELWVTVLLSDRDLYADAEQYFAARTPRSPQESRLRTRRATPRELNLILEQAQLSDCGLEPDRLCRWLLQRRAGGQRLSVGELIREQTRWIEATSATSHQAFRQLIGLLSVARPPILLVMPGGPCAQLVQSDTPSFGTGSLHRVAGDLAKLANCVPELTIGLAIDKDTWNTYVRNEPDGFAKAIVQEHVTFVEDLTSACVRPDSSDTVSKEVPSERDAWRSQQERFLFDLLESTPDTRGLFQLNATPGFLFGNRPAEIDLACQSLSIAIEIDGYYHFQVEDNYRRDRRKDLELQRHGYLILRFLAEDVVPDMQSILTTIREAVQFQTSKPQSNSSCERTH